MKKAATAALALALTAGIATHAHANMASPDVSPSAYDAGMSITTPAPTVSPSAITNTYGTTGNYTGRGTDTSGTGYNMNTYRTFATNATTATNWSWLGLLGLVGLVGLSGRNRERDREETQ